MFVCLLLNILGDSLGLLVLVGGVVGVVTKGGDGGPDGLVTTLTGARADSEPPIFEGSNDDDTNVGCRYYIGTLSLDFLKTPLLFSLHFASRGSKLT